MKARFFSSSSLLSVSMVKQYAYCPMIPWITAHHDYREPPTLSMIEARELAAEEKERIARSLGLPEPIRIEVPLQSQELGLTGIVDVVAGSRKLTVAEIKAYHRAKYDHYAAQLKAYALLVDRALGPVHRALLVLAGKPVLDIPVTHRVLQEARRLVEKTWKTVLSPHPPIVNPDPRKCTSCGYRRLCPHA